ncbi:IniB N-terminal domain-containing protein [Phytohabitans sp. ZYX-F-186]|uniref:IniB N-terminal domain-containing protein n=1 Tax=Phytohabitans maris TaxID=3071409 RepID=A0ABU0ZL07_9ACTN|nr:IniB N-terminal domain-containing protein [Phytohabitans sp. ZYX-F-186]MDQ7907741.1 IniB N-terminal domain-containing protein [Phytohabitans sp. ZYX-F-186]
MESTQTLHDFVLNLLTNPEARSAFELDPEGTLNAAGLGDITAADVQDVVPLVVDYAPVQGITGLVPTSDLSLGQLGALDGDATNVIGQLQTVTQQLGVAVPTPSADANVNIAAVGAITVDTTGVSLTTSGIIPGIGVAASTSGASVDLSGVHDVAGTLDSDVVGTVGADATGTIDSTLGTATGLVPGAPVDGVLDTTDDTLGTVDSQLDGVTGLVGSVTAPLGVPPVDLPELDDTLGADSLLSGTTGTVDSTLDGLGVGGLLGGGAEAHGSASVGGVQGTVHGSAGADAHTDGGLLGVTDILF